MIELRYPTPDDAEALHDAVRESLPELIPWMEWASESYDLDLARTWIEAQHEKRDRGSAFEFLIVNPEGEILGACGINRISAPPLRLANVGYWVRSSAAGQGIGAIAAHQVTEWAFTHTELVRLEIVVAVGNSRSQRVAEKVGATFEGIQKARLWTRGPQDAFMYSLVRPG